MQESIWVSTVRHLLVIQLNTTNHLTKMTLEALNIEALSLKLLKLLTLPLHCQLKHRLRRMTGQVWKPTLARDHVENIHPSQWLTRKIDH